MPGEIIARRYAPVIPYVAVAIGLCVLSSAWLAIGLYHAGILGVVVLLGLGKASRCTNHLKCYWVPVVTAIFTMGGVLLYTLWPLLGSNGQSIADRLARVGVTRSAWPCFAVYFCLVNATFEELFWRGCLYSDSRQIVPNDLLFAGYHAFVMIWFAHPIWILPVFVVSMVGGWLWRRLRLISGGLLLPILTHIVADASIVAAVQLRVFG